MLLAGRDVRGSPVAAALVAAVGLATAGCGVTSTAPPPSTPARWAANATGVIVQLRQDVATAATLASTLPEARKALHDESDLFGLLVAYTDLGGCRAMVATAGIPAARLAAAARQLAAACVPLTRAGAQFSRAVAVTNAGMLVAAARSAAAADPLLLRALDRVASARAG